ncbi:MAG: dockerin type I repeat-containing protein [Candidatus Zixiibacteriota bacterium]|nr:MAG: dockerin type I repeat-containing protein [candidate division Zixibacteria bacterium]
MNKVKLGMACPIALAFFAVLVVYAQSNKQLQPKNVKRKAVSEIEVAPVSIPERAPFKGWRQEYMMITDVLDGFGGESESDNYRIPVNSGGQSSAIGLSESDNYGVGAGFVHASHVNRGDVNSDGIVNLGDIVYLITYLYKGGPEPCPVEAGDVNCDGIVNLGDVVYLISYLYRGGPPPAC